DLHGECGCNSGNWQGRGAYYGGTRMRDLGDPEAQTQCLGFGGGWAGARDDGVPKGGISPHYRTRIWIRGTQNGNEGASLGATSHAAAPEDDAVLLSPPRQPAAAHSARASMPRRAKRGR